MVVNEILPKICSRFYCEICDYKTSKKSSYADHLLSTKHQKSMIFSEKAEFLEPIKNKKFVCKYCNKSYKDNSGLWRHSKKCSGESSELTEEHTPVKNEDANEPKPIITFNLNNNDVTKDVTKDVTNNDVKQLDAITELFREQLKENKELKEMLIEQNKKLIEIAEKSQGQVTNITNNTTNNTMNNFNMQIFLNEQCKDALNIMDFISQLQMKLTDLDMVGRVGYTEGISKIFIRGLKELDVLKRPIHCSDLKREVLYVKDKDSWEKDNEDKKKMKAAIKHIAAKNLKQINDWKEENPESDNYESKKHMEYHNIIINATGGLTQEEDEKNYNKIIRNIAKEVTINKTDSITTIIV